MILLKNGKIYPVEGEVIEKGDILIKDGKIEKIGQNLSEEQAEVIDLEGKNVYPGFVEAHCHLGLWEEGIGFEGSDGNESVNPTTPELRALDAINPMDEGFKDAYKAGVTTVAAGPGSANVIGGTFTALKTYGTRVDDMLVKDPVAMKIAFGENPKNVYSDQEKSPITRMANVSILREQLYRAEEYLKQKEEAEGDFEKMPEYDLGLEALAMVIKKEIPLKAHAHRADDILTSIRVAKEFDLDLTLDHCTEGHLIVDHIKAESYPAIVGPTLGNRSKVEVRNKSFETPSILARNGVKVSITTDAPVIPIEHLPLCAGLAIKAGMEEEEALKAITLNPAEIIGIDDRVGSLKEGKDADLVVYDGNPLKDICAETIMTIIDGEIVYKKA